MSNGFSSQKLFANSVFPPDSLTGLFLLAVCLAACNPTDAPTISPATHMAATVVMHDRWSTYADVGNVRDIVFDHNGILWAATKDGVVSLNPENNSYFRYTSEHGLASNDTSSIAVSPDGSVWVGTFYDGLSRFDGKSWTTYTTADGLPSNRIMSIAAADTELWVGTFFGASYFDGQSWNSDPKDMPGGHVMAVAPAPDGTVWFGTWENGIRHYGQKQVIYTGGDGLVHNDVNAITIDSNGVVWAGTSGGVSRFNGRIWTSYTTKDGLAGNLVMSIAVSPDGMLWCATWCEGVSYFDGKVWTTYTTEDGLADNCVQVVTVAPDKTLWFGTPNGISHYSPSE